MSFLQKIKDGHVGLFGEDVVKHLPPRYVAQLQKFATAADSQTLQLTPQELDDWADFADYVESENIELNEYQLEQMANVETYIKKKTHDGNAQSLYKETLTQSIKSFPIFSRMAQTHELETLFPEDYDKKLPTKGGWIMVAMEVPVEHKFRPTLYGIYYAKGFWVDHHLAKNVVKQYGVKSVPNAGRAYRVKISINGQNVVLHTYEYVVIEDAREVLASVGTDYEMIKGGGDANIEADRVHYLMTRGVPREAIYMRLLATVNSMTFCHFVPKPEFIERLRLELTGKRKRVLEDNPFYNFTPPQIEVKW